MEEGAYSSPHPEDTVHHNREGMAGRSTMAAECTSCHVGGTGSREQTGSEAIERGAKPNIRPLPHLMKVHQNNAVS